MVKSLMLCGLAALAHVCTAQEGPASYCISPIGSITGTCTLNADATACVDATACGAATDTVDACLSANGRVATAPDDQDRNGMIVMLSDAGLCTVSECQGMTTSVMLAMSDEHNRNGMIGMSLK